MAEASSVGGGTVIRGSDGSLYFIRDELLDAFKIEGEGLQRITQLLEEDAGGDVSGYDFRSTYESNDDTMEPLRYVSGDLLQDQPADREVPSMQSVKSTVMCPWFC